MNTLRVSFNSFMTELSYRNKSINLIRKSMDWCWFLYDNGLSHERVNDNLLLSIDKKVCFEIIQLFLFFQQDVKVILQLEYKNKLQFTLGSLLIFFLNFSKPPALIRVSGCTCVSDRSFNLSEILCISILLFSESFTNDGLLFPGL